MSRDQRVNDNHALLAAQQDALVNKLPLVVCFNLLTSIGVRSREHYEFMLKGIEEVAKKLEKLQISFILTHGRAKNTISELIREMQACAVYLDFSPLDGPRALSNYIASTTDASVYVVDTHNIIPVWLTSDKQEFAAHTIRRKIHKHLEAYLVEPMELTKHTYISDTEQFGITFETAKKYISQIEECGIKIQVKPGSDAALDHLKQFIEHGLDTFALGRNDIANDKQSGLSPYLHFGQLSSLRVALEVLYAVNERPLLFDEAKVAQNGETPNKIEGMNALYEEMIVRKELSDNFCLYAKSYVSLEGANEWAIKTLDDHAKDSRVFLYTRKQLESASTHDEAWNTAQRQLTMQGNIHGYMRMYWAKKILEWTQSPDIAIEHAIYLNDKYSIDGGDPNGYVGILWSIAGVHDRPWTEREIFGKIRYMNEAVLKRKFDLERYINST